MNKKFNTLIFIIAGTIVNIVIMGLLLLGMILILNPLLVSDMNENLMSGIFMFSVLMAVIASFFIYAKLIKIINRKWDLEQWIEPILKRRR